MRLVPGARPRIHPEENLSGRERAHSLSGRRTQARIIHIYCLVTVLPAPRLPIPFPFAQFSGSISARVRILWPNPSV
jgi:hypothetical protein